MRLLAVGLLLVVVAVASSEWIRLHPPSSVPDAGPAAGPSSAPVDVLATASLPGPQPAHTEEWTAPLGSPTLAGAFSARNLVGRDGVLALVVEKDGKKALVLAPPDAPPRVLAVRGGPVANLALEAQALLWTEGGVVWAVPLEGGEVRARVAFAEATVVGLDARGGKLLLALVPRLADPLSDEPIGAVALVSGGAPTLVAGEQIRPREVALGEADAFWIAGYPSGLLRGSLDGAAVSRLVERADGPLLPVGPDVVYRVPVSGAPEVRRTPQRGGASTTLGRLEAEHLNADGSQVAFSSAGFSPHLYLSTGAGEAEDVAALEGEVKGVAFQRGRPVVLLSAEGGTRLSRIEKDSAGGSRDPR